MDYIFSKHALEQMLMRNIPKSVVETVLSNPGEIIIQEKKNIYQSIVTFQGEGNYLIRVFVNTVKRPNIVITVYKTSKISKYYEGEI